MNFIRLFCFLMMVASAHANPCNQGFHLKSGKNAAAIPALSYAEEKIEIYSKLFWPAVGRQIPQFKKLFDALAPRKVRIGGRLIGDENELYINGTPDSHGSSTVYVTMYADYRDPAVKRVFVFLGTHRKSALNAVLTASGIPFLDHGLQISLDSEAFFNQALQSDAVIAKIVELTERL